MTTTLQRIRRGAMLFVATVFVAVVGYRVLFGHSWVDALYMVVITVSSVGFTDVYAPGPPGAAERLFTIAVIVVGMTAGAYTIGALLQLIAEGEVDRLLGIRRMTREIKQLHQHVIVCGFGRIGQLLAHDLKRQGLSLVLLEMDPQRVREAQAHEFLVITGDATHEELLVQAGVERAQSLVTALPSDADNVFITLTARNLRPDLQIIARAEHRSSEKKLLQAGANRVVMPASSSAVQMAQMITRPAAADFFELLSDRTQLDLVLDEVQIPPGGELVGRTVGQSETHRHHRLLVLAIKPQDGEMVFDPPDERVFAAGDTLIVMGRTADIDQFERDYRLRI